MSRKGGHNLVSPFSVVLIMVALSVLGIASIPRLNVQYIPSSSGRSIQIYYSLRDAAAELVEAEATSRLEGVLSGIRGITEVSSVSQKEFGQINLQFRKGTNMDAARFEVASAVRNIYPSLPKGITYPEIVVESDDSRQDVGYAIAYYLKGSLPSKELDEYARESLLPAFSLLKGVDAVDLSGATPYHWVITFDAQKASAAGVTATEIANAIRCSYSNAVLGTVDDEKGRLTIRLGGPGLPDFGSIPVKNVGGTVLSLRDLATWRYEESLPESYYRVNGLNTITLAISVAESENMLTTVSTIKKEMARIQSTFPFGITASVAYDATEYVNKELKKIYLRTGLCVLILLLFVFLLSRSWRYLLIITATLAVNVLTSIAIYAFVGLHIHIYTLAGITVSLGILIDTSIVMADHYGYWQNRKVFPAMIMATTTTVAALLMILLLPENVRESLTDFVWVIIINLILSLVVSYFFLPSLMEYLSMKTVGLSVSRTKTRRVVQFNAWYYRYLYWGLSHKWVLILLFVIAFGIPTCLLPSPSPKSPDMPPASGFKRFFERLASWTPYADNRDVVDKWLGSSFGLFYDALNRSNFDRRPERKQLYIRAGMQEGATVGQLNEVVKSMENYLAGFDGIESFTTSISQYNDAILVVDFKPEFEHTLFPFQLKNQVKTMATNYGGANWIVSGIDQNYFNNNVVRHYKSYGITLRGYNYQDLLRFAKDLCTYLSTNGRVRDPEVWGTNRYTRPATEFNLVYDLESIAAARVNPYAYYQQLSSRLYDREIGMISYDGTFSDVVVRSSESDSYDLWHVLHAPMFVDSTAITLSEVGTILKKPTGIDIKKQNQSYQVVVCFDFVGSHNLAKKTIKEAVAYMNSFVLPVGFKAENEDDVLYGVQESLLAWIVILIVAILFVMLAMAFESLRYPYAVILMIPVSFIGLFLTFGLTNISFDQGGFAALIMLCGIVVNAGIYLVTTFQQYGGTNVINKEEQVKQYIKAFNHKIIPIFLTIVSTILGLLPFLSDGPDEVFWFDFAIGTIGGLVFSIIALFFYLPVFLLNKK